MIKKEGEKWVLEFSGGRKEKFGTEEAAKKREKEIQAIKHAETEPDTDGTLITEALSKGESERIVSSAFRKEFVPRITPGIETDYENRPFVSEVYDDFVLATVGQHKNRVDYTMDKKGDVTFAPRQDWKRVELEVVTVESEAGSRPEHTIFAEHFPAAAVLDVLEEGKAADIVLIEPGMGNKRDKHYYSPELLRTHAPKFIGAKMYATNHKEHNVRNWVATVTESGKRFTLSGAPIARVAVHSESFWTDLKNLNEHGLVHTMHNSILATGKARQGKVNGKSANIVETIEAIKSVDFVPRAGAGGHVVALVEQLVEEGDLDLLTFAKLAETRPDLIERVRSEEKTKLYAKIAQLQEFKEGSKPQLTKLQEDLQMAQDETKVLEERIVTLEEANTELEKNNEALLQTELKNTAIAALLENAVASKLPKPALEKIKSEIQEGTFDADADVTKIVVALVEEEVEYIKSLTPDVKVRGMGESETTEKPKADTRTLEERQKATDAVLAGYGSIPVTKEVTTNAVS